MGLCLIPIEREEQMLLLGVFGSIGTSPFVMEATATGTIEAEAVSNESIPMMETTNAITEEMETSAEDATMELTNAPAIEMEENV